MDLIEENLDTSADSSFLDATIESNLKAKKVIKKKKTTELKLELNYENIESYSESESEGPDEKIDNTNYIIVNEMKLGQRRNVINDYDTYFVGPSKKSLVKAKMGEKFTQKVSYRNYDKYLRAYERETEIDQLFAFNKTKTHVSKYDEFFNKFAQIGIFLKICTTAKEFSTRFVRLKEEINSFLIDLIRAEDYSYIMVFFGESSKVEITDIRTDINQLVLHVKEPSRTIQVDRKEWDSKKRKVKWVTESQTTPEDSYILIGEDEGNPFMSLLPEKVVTVEEAHECLKPDIIKNMDPNKYTRQGEWFFVETGKEFPKKAVKNKEDLSNGKGRPHKVSKLINLGDEIDKEYVIKGYVSHPDHHNLKFSRWARVYENKELILKSIKGVTWID